jgi:hypothetical protein
VLPVKYEQGFYIPEDDILHSHRRENLKSYMMFIIFRNTCDGPKYISVKLRARKALQSLSILNISVVFLQSRGSVVVKALSYKPEGRGFET